MEKPENISRQSVFPDGQFPGLAAVAVQVHREVQTRVLPRCRPLDPSVILDEEASVPNDPRHTLRRAVLDGQPPLRFGFHRDLLADWVRGRFGAAWERPGVRRQGRLLR